MPAQKRFRMAVVAIVGLFLLLFLIAFSRYHSIKNQEQESASGWPTPQVASARLENSGETSRTNVLENTDFKRKIVRFRTGTSQSQKLAALESVNAEVIKDIDGDTVLVEVPDENLSDSERTLNENSEVESAETDYAVSFSANPDWGVKRIRADRVWDTTTAGGTSVAVIDTGVDLSHSEFSERYAGGYDFVNEDSDPQDDHGHGTAVAGIALAAMNGSGTIGVGPDSSLLVVKVLGADGYGYISDLVEGINWAVENGASIINMSLGTTYDSSILKQTVDSAASSGTLLVAAAGNTNGGSLVYPAAYDSVIAVGATDSNDKLASFSAVGSELVAPGVSITAPWVGGGYVTISGTSASSPHVAGVAAHLLSEGKSGVRSALRKGTVDLGEEGVDPYFGHGLTDAVLALEIEDDDSDPMVSFISPREGQKLSGKVVVNIEAEDDKEVLKVDLIVNGEFVYSSATHPYQWLWDLQNSPEEIYELTARAYDENGNVGEATINVEVVRTALGPLPTNLPTQVPATSGGQMTPQEPSDAGQPESAPTPDIQKTPSQNQQSQNFTPQNAGGNSGGRGNVRGVSTTKPLTPFEVLLLAFGV